MKKVLFLLLFTALSISLSAQISFDLNFFKKPKAAISAGYHGGGGGWAGVDFEYLPQKNIGIQAGVGILSYGFGVNYHFNKGGVRSPYVQLGYWHQGFGDRHTQSLVGPTFVYRFKRFVQLQGGFGARVGTGPALNPDITFPFALMYSVSLYLPVK
jgi:hypothetical protein